MRVSDDERSTLPGMVLIAIGGALLLAALVWMTVIGYYPNQLPTIIVMLGFGAGLAWFGERMYQTAKRETVLRQIEQRDEGTE